MEISPGISLKGMMLKLKPVLWPLHAKSWLIGKDWYWEGLGAGREGGDRGWDGWMASPTWWTWVWVNSGCWWWTGRPGVLRFMGSQRVGHNWATQLNWTEWELRIYCLNFHVHYPAVLTSYHVVHYIPRTELLWWSNSEDSVLPTQGAWVPSLVRELIPHAATKTWYSQLNK